MPLTTEEQTVTALSYEDLLLVRDDLRRAHGRELPLDSPAAFLTYARHGKWWLAPHLKYLNSRILAANRGKTKRLIVVMPPRHGKSEFISAGTAAWWLGIHPDQRVMLASYEADFAASWGRKARDLLEVWGPSVFGVQVSGLSSAAHRWDILGYSGGMTTAGVGGSFTGRGAHLLIVDDPVKNAEQAMSLTYRDKAWDWWLSTAYTRLEPGGVAIVIMTRWHEDDLVGRLISSEYGQKDDWEIIWFPALAMQGDQLGRAVGQALWPERYDTPVLEEIKRTLGSYYFSALYQGLPIPESGALFKRKWFNYAERINGNYVLKQGDHVTMVPVDKCIVFMTVDLAISTDDSADYTCIGTWALTPNKDLILLDVVRERIEGPDQLRVIASVRERFGASRIGIERTQYQLSLVQAAVRAGLPAVGLKADGGNKVARALTVAARYEANAVYHTKGPWLDEYEKELLSFDKGEHDDQVDMAAYAAQFLMQRSTGVTATVLG